MARRAEPHQTSAFAKVTVSVVSHGHADYLRHLLQDLNASAARIEKVVVTRNIPEPDVLSDLRLDVPLEVVDNAAPKGFSANHNAAFRRCATPWFLVLNPDVRMDGRALGTLLDQAAADSGVLAPRIMEPGKSVPEPHRHHLTPFEIMGRWVRPGYDAPRADWVPGVFMLFRSAAFGAVGGFDEKFFMYVEDADICVRLRLAGWDVAVNESVRVLHDAQRASDRHWRALGWHWASMLKWWFSAPFWRPLVGRVIPAAASPQPRTANAQTSRPK